jgi:hypothetical protein
MSELLNFGGTHSPAEGRMQSFSRWSLVQKASGVPKGGGLGTSVRLFGGTAVRLFDCSAVR